MEMRQLNERLHLDPRLLSAWIEADWLSPATARAAFDLSEDETSRAPSSRHSKLISA